MRTVAVAMQKGGSGKTTTAVNLAAALAEKGQRVLVVDVDPQANATSWFGARDVGKGIFACLCENGSVSDTLIPTATAGVDLVPASAWLVGAERALAAEVGAETILRRRLKPAADGYDVALVDTPPTLGVLTVGALVAADQVLVPVEAHVMALNGLAQLLRTVETVRDRLNEGLGLLGMVACRVDARTRHGIEVVEELRKRFPEQTFRTVIRENIRLAEAPSFGQPVTAYDGKSAGAEDYRALAAEVLNRWQAAGTR
ncbi:MAG: ParA family protein [Acetobacteraceae bacterium]|nr:ParA family protein [Acetobacteraceae bacterium]